MFQSWFMPLLWKHTSSVNSKVQFPMFVSFIRGLGLRSLCNVGKLTWISSFSVCYTFPLPFVLNDFIYLFLQERGRDRKRECTSVWRGRGRRRLRAEQRVSQNSGVMNGVECRCLSHTGALHSTLYLRHRERMWNNNSLYLNSILKL